MDSDIGIGYAGTILFLLGFVILMVNTKPRLDGDEKIRYPLGIWGDIVGGICFGIGFLGLIYSACKIIMATS